ncbi:MAG: PIN domain-containing protein [Pseudomonadota bacterium]
MDEGAREGRWFLDACVLVPQLPREIILGAAGAGLITPFWSPRVLEEWRIAAARRGGAAAGVEAERDAVRRAEAMAAAYPAASVRPDPEREAVLAGLMRDRADAHVVAAALVAHAVVITFNLRDFPARRLAEHGVAVSHPDAALLALMDDHGPGMSTVIETALARLDRPVPDRAAGRAALKRCGMPRCGKLWAA